jgi:hypothetical protein
VRLIGIDTPETCQPGTPAGGKQATSRMLGLAFTAPEDTDADGLLDREGGEGQRVIDPTRRPATPSTACSPTARGPEVLS